MPLKITVALAGDPETALVQSEGSILGMRHPEDFEQPYEARLKVEIDAEVSDTLRTVLGRAAEAFGVRAKTWSPDPMESVAFVDFHRDGEAPSLRSELALVDEQGRVRFTHRWKEVTYRELLAAEEAGTLAGDPRRPYLLLQPGIGNGLMVDWQTLVVAWVVFWEILDKTDITLSLGERAKRALEKLRGRGGDAPAVLEGLYAGWQERGGRVDNIDALLGQRPWHLQDLADLLGCSTGQAEAFLLGAGYAASPQTGLWSRGQDEVAQLLHGNLEFVIHMAMTTRRDAVERVLRDRLERLLETGEAPPLDWQDLADLPDDGVGLRDPNQVAAEQARLQPHWLTRLWWRIRYR